MRFLNIAARLSFSLLLGSLAIGLVAGIGTHVRLWNARVGLGTLFPYCVYAGIAAVALGLLWALAGIGLRAGAGARYGVVGLLGSIVVLWVPLHDLYLVRIEHSIPPIHDISTDTEHPPEFLALRNHRAGADTSPDYAGPNRVKFEGRTYTSETLQKLYYGEIKPKMELGTTPAKLFQRALSAAGDMGWTIAAVAAGAQGGQIEATDTTVLFGLTDDIAIRVKPAGIGARLDIRSKSREAGCDYGRNAARIERYLNRLAGS